MKKLMAKQKSIKKLKVKQKSIKMQIDWILTVKVLFLKIRRELYITFKPRTVIRILRNRPKNFCAGCKTFCCKNILERTPFTCKHLKKDGSCDSYDKLDFPISCSVYPLGLIDVDLYGIDCNIRKDK